MITSSAPEITNEANGSETLRNAAALTARILLAVLFLLSGLGKAAGYDQAAAFMTSNGVPMVGLLLPATIAIELAGALALIAGAWVRVAALALVLWMVPVTLVFHAFWAVEPAQQQAQRIHFLKNLAIAGGLLVIVVHGAGGWSVDRRRRKERA